MVWRYEPDETPKRKHAWNETHAGFEVGRGGELVGKCPKNLAPRLLDSLLNEGIPWSKRTWRKPYPQRIYAILDEVLYRAVPTNGGVSYHGFPELADLVPPDRPLREAILARAHELGCARTMKRFLS